MPAAIDTHAENVNVSRLAKRFLATAKSSVIQTYRLRPPFHDSRSR
jgi:hypothetical protein